MLSVGALEPSDDVMKDEALGEGAVRGVQHHRAADFARGLCGDVAAKHQGLEPDVVAVAKARGREVGLGDGLGERAADRHEARGAACELLHVSAQIGRVYLDVGLDVLAVEHGAAREFIGVERDAHVGDVDLHGALRDGGAMNVEGGVIDPALDVEFGKLDRPALLVDAARRAGAAREDGLDGGRKVGDVEVCELHVAAPAERVDPCDLASDAARTARSLRGELVERERGEGAAALEAGGGGRSARRLDAKSCIELPVADVARHAQAEGGERGQVGRVCTFERQLEAGGDERHGEREARSGGIGRKQELGGHGTFGHGRKRNLAHDLAHERHVGLLAAHGRDGEPGVRTKVERPLARETCAPLEGARGFGHLQVEAADLDFARLHGGVEPEFVDDDGRGARKLEVGGLEFGDVEREGKTHLGQLCEERLREEVGEHFVELGCVERDHGLSGLELGLDLGCATLGNLPVLFGPFLGCLLGAGQRDRKRADAKGFDGERLSDPGGGGAEVG